MKPGDLVICSSCGSEGRVWSTGAQHVDGWPVLITWPGDRTAVEHTGQKARSLLVCLPCDDVRLGIERHYPQRRERDANAAAAGKAGPSTNPGNRRDAPAVAPVSGQRLLF